MTDSCLTTQAFTLKGRLYTFTVISLLSTNYADFKQQLIDVVAKAPLLFKDTSVILDCSALKNAEIDLFAYCEYLREKGLFPIGIQRGVKKLEELAKTIGLAVLNSSGAHDKPLPALNADKSSAKNQKSKMITSPVRSGQQIVSNADLIISSSVSHGAELLADGHIHIYGSLRGRALAGISGNKDARIFCQSLEAELVSIAGFYRLSDAIEKITGPCQIYLKNDHIQIDAL